MINFLGRLMKRLYFFPYLRYKMLSTASHLFNPRGAELDFVNDNLPRLRVIDIGASHSLFVYNLAKQGHDVYALDQRDYQEPIRMGVKFIKHDILQPLTGYREYFDVATLISSFEHFGLGEYGDPVNNDGYKIAAQNITDMLKPGGVMLITVPKSYGFNLYKIIYLFPEMRLQHYRVDDVNVMAKFRKGDREWKSVKIASRGNGTKTIMDY